MQILWSQTLVRVKLTLLYKQRKPSVWEWTIKFDSWLIKLMFLNRNYENNKFTSMKRSSPINCNNNQIFYRFSSKNIIMLHMSYISSPKILLGWTSHRKFVEIRFLHCSPADDTVLSSFFSHLTFLQCLGWAGWWLAPRLLVAPKISPARSARSLPMTVHRGVVRMTTIRSQATRIAARMASATALGLRMDGSSVRPQVDSLHLIRTSAVRPTSFI